MTLIDRIKAVLAHIKGEQTAQNTAIAGKANLAGGNTFSGVQTVEDLLIKKGSGGSADRIYFGSTIASTPTYLTALQGLGQFEMYSGTNLLARFGLTTAFIRGAITFNNPLTIQGSGTESILRAYTGSHYWEVGNIGNNFAVRNVTTGNTTPFVIDRTTNNVGVGTTTPNAKLDIVTTGIADNLELDSTGSGVTGLRLATDSVIKGYWATPRTNSQYFLNSTAGDMVFRSESNKIHFGRGSGNSAMTVDGLNVGVGTATPTGKFTVSSTGGGNSGIRLENSNAGSYAVIDFINAGGLTGQFLATGSAFSNGIFGPNQTAIANYTGSTLIHSNGFVSIATGGFGTTNERIRVVANGNVGINTTTPLRTLHVVGASPVLSTINTYNGAIIENNDNVSLLLATGTNKEAVISFGGSSNNNIGQIAYSNATDSMRFRVNNVDRININSAGNIGIGTASPTSKLHVTGLPVFADNATALTSGMTAGAFYHAGDGIVRVVF